MNKIKKLYMTYVILSFLGISIILFIVSSRLVAYFKTADKAIIRFRPASQKELLYQPSYTWKPLQNEGREMEKHTLKKINKDYLASYYYQNETLAGRKTAGLKDHFTEKSREKVMLAALETEQQQQEIRSTTIAHHLTLDFYSEDGTLVVLKDTNISHYQLFENEQFILSGYDTTSYDVMLLLEDNFWRIRHKVRSETENPVNVSTSNECTKTEGKHFLVDNVRFISKGINYYPADFPWHLFWDNVNTSLLHSDFGLIKSAHFNTLRIFVPYEKFGGAEVQEEYIIKLGNLLDIAHKHNLKVIVTLFDFFLGYDVNKWTLSDRHTEGIVTRFKHHPAIFSWDIKNEPDLDFESKGKETVMEWLSFTCKRIKSYDPNHLITIGWSSPEYITALKNDVDYYSFHYYKAPEDLPAYLKADFDKPLLLEEMGQHSYSSWWYPFRKTKEDQYQYLSELTKVIRENALSYAIWTLYDFRKISDNVVGKIPWRKNIQKNFGLIGNRNKKKKAFQLMSDFNKNYL